MSKKKMLTEAEAAKLANDTFDRILGNPQDGNARIIAARRANTARKFKSKDMVKRANTSAGAHVSQARKALKRLGPPSLERFKA